MIAKLERTQSNAYQNKYKQGNPTNNGKYNEQSINNNKILHLTNTKLLSSHGLSPPVKYFTDRSKAVLLLWIFYAFSVLCLLCLCACLFICALWSPAGKGLTSWLSFVVSNCEFVTFPLVSWVRCDSGLYRLLIFAPLLTFLNNAMYHHKETIKSK